MKSKQFLKGVHRQVRLWATRRFRAFGANELAAAIARLGIGPGDCLMVHSAWDAFLGFEGSPTDVVRVLQRTVGPSGLLMMPTMPFDGTAFEFIGSRSAVDLARAPSKMGLLTEIFRRMPDVQRSLHPTHPIAVWGEGAAEVARLHARAVTPCGRPGPFETLHERSGRILLMGTGFGVLTFFHFIEERLEPRMPFSPFCALTFDVEVRPADGSPTVQVHTRVFDPAVSRRRDMQPLLRELRDRHEVRSGRVGGLTLIRIDARPVVAAVERLAERGVFCYG